MKLTLCNCSCSARDFTTLRNPPLRWKLFWFEARYTHVRCTHYRGAYSSRGITAWRPDRKVLRVPKYRRRNRLARLSTWKIVRYADEGKENCRGFGLYVLAKFEVTLRNCITVHVSVSWSFCFLSTTFLTEYSEGCRSSIPVSVSCFKFLISPYCNFNPIASNEFHLSMSPDLFHIVTLYSSPLLYRSVLRGTIFVNANISHDLNYLQEHCVIGHVECGNTSVMYLETYHEDRTISILGNLRVYMAYTQKRFYDSRVKLYGYTYESGTQVKKFWVHLDDYAIRIGERYISSDTYSIRDTMHRKFCVNFCSITFGCTSDLLL